MPPSVFYTTVHKLQIIIIIIVPRPSKGGLSTDCIRMRYYSSNFHVRMEKINIINCRCFFLLEDQQRLWSHLTRRKDPRGRYLSSCTAEGTWLALEEHTPPLSFVIVKWKSETEPSQWGWIEFIHKGSCTQYQAFALKGLGTRLHCSCKCYNYSYTYLRVQGSLRYLLIIVAMI